MLHLITIRFYLVWEDFCVGFHFEEQENNKFTKIYFLFIIWLAICNFLAFQLERSFFEFI